ncbi:PREDICTED: CDP-diacylglycerol--glycerol-3-phosphate 3-phosphatidyltransferase 2-like [Ipomoea nil]|uniref:CDP-diacylglycerol--glycerol-3-phosphate 3-phosphatidyltransferase 2-like n=1 Tax=Ipomoea nil TaxID=35883 RepID=UPI00090108E5|nr:PREDICTED: CDP-diacylglycerol--glycerol-3-phosphate 3-phosphatidyltransferase 2-like [Ipomoea nil]
MAGGALKLHAVVTSIYSQKPYTWARTISSAAKSETLRGPAASTPRWRRRIPFPAPVRGVPNYQISLGFHNRDCSPLLPVRSISTTQMGSDPDKKEQQLPDTVPSQSDKLLTLPTILTIGRVAAVPLLVSTFYVDSWWGPAATTGIFIAAAITDWLDGYIARKKKLGTAFGAFLDPVADKLMVAATLVLLCTRPLEASAFVHMPWLLTVPSIAIIGREITMSAVREWAASQGSKLSEAVAVNNLGKWKTATQMSALTILLATRDSSLVDAGALVGSGVALLYISAWLAVWSLFVYMRKIWKVLLV